MPRTITTEATGRRETIPKLAVVELTAVGGGDTADGARATARDRSTTVRESMTTVDAEQIRTTDLCVEPTEVLFDAETEDEYEATERLRVDCTPDTVESVVVEATDAGGSVVGVEFELHDEERRRLRDEALTAAMERARTKAERLADAERLSVGDVRSVTTSTSSLGMEGIVVDAMSSLPDADVRPDPITVSECVEVEYELVS